MKPSTSSRWLSDQAVILGGTLRHTHQSANATLPWAIQLRISPAAMAAFWHPAGQISGVILHMTGQ